MTGVNPSVRPGGGDGGDDGCWNAQPAKVRRSQISTYAAIPPRAERLALFRPTPRIL